MRNLIQLKKKLSKESRKVSINASSKLLADFFNGEVVELNAEYQDDT